MKYECKKIDYCPCIDCDERWVKVPDGSMGKIGLEHGFEKIKVGIEFQYKERIKNIPEDIKKEFFKLIREGKNLGQARILLGLGLGAIGQLVMDNIHEHRFLSYQDPYTKQEQFDNVK